MKDTPVDLNIQTNITMRNLAALCVEYGGDFRWETTAGVPKTEDAIRYFINCGMSLEEVKEMMLVINMQRRSATSSEFGEDFAKMNEIGKQFGFTITTDEAEKYANPDPNGKNDFAHMIVASASIAGQNALKHQVLNLILGFGGKAGLNSEISALSHIKGDIHSAGVDPVEIALPEADYNSNLDAVNISNRVKRDQTVPRAV